MKGNRPHLFRPLAFSLAAALITLTACAPQEAAQEGPAALSEDRLRFFNEEFFNTRVENGYNIRNQFLSSTYDSPEGIDLHELFYCEGATPSGGELWTILGVQSDDMPCPAYKLTTAEMDAILTEHMGLTLADTDRVNLTYTYDETTDAYYWMHGDTNYRSHVDITAGTDDGGTVSLYYEDYFLGGGWKCVTLSTQPDGGYHFVSNLPCEQPAVPTPLPDGEAAAVIPLSSLEPYEAPAVTLTTRSGDFQFSYENNLHNWDIGGHHVRIYRSVDGTIRAALEEDDGTMQVFLDLLGENCDMSFFHGLFGQDGFYVDYFSTNRSRPYAGMLRDYYYFTADGDLALLARCELDGGTARILDLDGDGVSELCTSRQIFFLRDGAVYEARLDALLKDACPELSYWDYSSWNVYGKYLTATGLTGNADGLGGRSWTRQLYFADGSILVYRDVPTVHDHVADDVSEAMPAEVLTAAKAYVEGILDQQADGTWLPADRAEDGTLQEIYDDWRITAVTGSTSLTLGDVTVEGWAFNYECHTTTPERVVLAGGKYLTEDGWVSPGYPGCDWLFFRLDGDTRTYLWHEMNNDMSPDSVAFRANVIDHLSRLQVDLGSTTYAALEAETDLDALLLTDRLSLSLSGGASYDIAPGDESLAWFRSQIFAPANYRWTRLDAAPDTPDGQTLILADRDWYQQLQFWAGSDLVMSKRSHMDPVWFRVESLFDSGDVFYDASRICSVARTWYDEVELAALRSGILIPDGEDRLAIAQAWASAWEGAHRDAAPGGGISWTYCQVTDVALNTELPVENYPADLAGKDAFLFSYTTIFVPENDLARSRSMAGNTVDYTGTDPAVPDGALEFYRLGYLYHTQDGWRCDGVGTGP